MKKKNIILLAIIGIMIIGCTSNQIAAQITNPIKIVKFESLPNNVEEFKRLSAYDLSKEYNTAALFIVALSQYNKNQTTAIEMINLLKGPKPLDDYDMGFLKRRMEGKKEYLANSYFLGSSPSNNYTPKKPYSVRVSYNKYSYAEANYVKVFITSSGADSPRPITLRKKGNKWYLWEYSSILLGIRKSKEQDPWAE